MLNNPSASLTIERTNRMSSNPSIERSSEKMIKTSIPNERSSEKMIVINNNNTEQQVSVDVTSIILDNADSGLDLYSENEAKQEVVSGLTNQEFFKYARATTENIRVGILEVADAMQNAEMRVNSLRALVREAKESKIWKAMNYTSWTEYCKKEFDSRRLHK